MLTLALILLPRPGARAVQSQGNLTPTAHAALPDDPTDLWLVPTGSDRASRNYPQYEPLAEAVKRYGDGEYARAAQLGSRPSLAATPLAGYAAFEPNGDPPAGDGAEPGSEGGTLRVVVPPGGEDPAGAEAPEQV